MFPMKNADVRIPRNSGFVPRASNKNGIKIKSDWLAKLSTKNDTEASTNFFVLIFLYISFDFS